jgi:acyl-CoA dehydrogenase
MDFSLSDATSSLLGELTSFMTDVIYPAEPVYAEQLRNSGQPHTSPPIMEELKAEARRRGLWNLFLPHPTDKTPGLAGMKTPGLSNVEYAPLAELSGRSAIAPEAINCNAPDSGNMEILYMFGTPEQRERWLLPLLQGEIRSCFAMTEPAVASSDANNIELRIVREGDHYILNGRKWWISNAADPRCAFAVVMGKTDPNAPRHRQQSMIIVPLDTPGVTVTRNLTVFGYVDRPGHCEIDFEDVRVPIGNLLGDEGSGFAIAQARLGPGRIHNCMRAIGAAERALGLMCQRVSARYIGGKPLAEQGVMQQWIAEARLDIDQVRLYTLHAAWLMDTVGNRQAHKAIAGIKALAPRMATRVVDTAIQAFGGAGFGPDEPLAELYASMRILRVADGPDEVQLRSVARLELRQQLATAAF